MGGTRLHCLALAPKAAAEEGLRGEAWSRVRDHERAQLVAIGQAAAAPLRLMVCEGVASRGGVRVGFVEMQSTAYWLLLHSPKPKPPAGMIRYPGLSHKTLPSNRLC